MKKHLPARLLVCSLFLSPVFLPAQTLKPYLQSATDHSIWIGWRTAADTESTVLWGESPDALNNVASGDVHTFAANNLWHRVKLDNLQPNTAYFYQVKSGTQVSPVARFRTYPDPATAGGHVRVLIVGDTQHPGNATTTFNAAKAKLIEKYGSNIEDNVHLILKQGDNVDQGTLALYSSMHFDPLSVLSANIPTMTVIGNHEYYQNSDLSLYFPHFEFDDPALIYNNMAGQDGEHYYAFRVGKVLFCMLNSNEWWSRQTDWLEDVVQTANADPSVGMIFGTAHHPLRCENWVSDGSAYIREQIIPTLRASEKAAMYTSGHSHMYARGSNRDSSLWEVISGGGGLVQNWNENEEQDYPDVQRSFDVSTYQIMDIDLDAGTMEVECYTTGNFEYTMPNVLIDRFHRYLGKPQPARPDMLPLADTLVTLPFTFEGSPYFSPVGELNNSTQFQVAGASGNFDNDLMLDLKRDFENYYQIESAAYFSPIDQMAGVNIFQIKLDSTQVFQGKNWIRVRYRDQNLEWSDWSEPMAFYAQNGQMPLSLEPIAWWHFNGDAMDATGHGFDGTVPPTGVTFPQDEPVRGQVASFDNSQSITVRSGADAALGLPVAQMTVSSWVKVNAADTWGGFIGNIQDTGPFEKGWALGTRDQRFSIALMTENASAMTYLTDTENFILGEWYYVTATYNGAVLKIFVNGQLKNSSTAQNGDIVYAGLVSDRFVIGAYVDENENWVHDGALDELILWERALGDTEVLQLYQEQSNLAPGIVITSPAPNSMYTAPASIAISAEANDMDGTVSVVEFFNGAQKIYEDVDGAPYAFVWDNAPAGIHILTARATDNLGARSVSAPVEVIVLVNTAPQVSLLNPADSSVYTAPAQITLVATASDAEGNVPLVEFFANGDKIGEDNDGVPYFFNWTDVPAGEYLLTALATDEGGQQTSSPQVYVRVETDV
ncbi:MAG: Ig-like domain-containing protein, partial [Saprospiraceae bacterium]|nr:Ig-like domain-containing protein [Saprospiraceae bacterium]